MKTHSVTVRVHERIVLLKTLTIATKQFDQTSTCRNIRFGAEFTCYIERGGFLYEPKYTLRCATCHCRHKAY